MGEGNAREGEPRCRHHLVERARPPASQQGREHLSNCRQLSGSSIPWGNSSVCDTKDTPGRIGTLPPPWAAAFAQVLERPVGKYCRPVPSPRSPRGDTPSITQRVPGRPPAGD